MENNIIVSEKEYNSSFERQGGRCAICKKHQTEIDEPLTRDISPIDGRMGDLLCKKCITILNLVNRKEETLIKMNEYMKTWKLGPYKNI